MPTYEYYCEKCKKGFEMFQSMKDSPLTVCPKELCRQKKWGKGKVRRQLGTGAGLIFKGTGFYTTDYRSEGYKAAEKKETPAPAETKAADPKSTNTPASKKADSASASAEKPKPSAKKD